VARGTLGGAVAAAGELPEPLGAALLGAAREAFMQAFGATVVISAVMSIGVAVLAVLLLRQVKLT
jgi:DHA2 family multidrug resistance protein-like MFS transporter